MVLFELILWLQAMKPDIRNMLLASNIRFVSVIRDNNFCGIFHFVLGVSGSLDQNIKLGAPQYNFFLCKQVSKFTINALLNVGFIAGINILVFKSCKILTYELISKTVFWVLVSYPYESLRWTKKRYVIPLMNTET